MNKAISAALLAGGVLLIIWGIQGSKSVTSEVSRFFTGAPTDKVVWLLIGGIIAAVAGLAGLLRNRKS